MVAIYKKRNGLLNYEFAIFSLQHYSISQIAESDASWFLVPAHMPDEVVPHLDFQMQSEVRLVVLLFDFFHTAQ